MNNASAIVKSLREQPGDWKASCHTLRHESSGISLWIANGLFSLGTWEYESSTKVYLGVIGRLRVWRAYRQWKKLEVHTRLTTEVVATPKELSSAPSASSVVKKGFDHARTN